MLKPFYIACLTALTCTAALAAPLRLLSDERSVGSRGSASSINWRYNNDGSVSNPTVVQDIKPATTFQHVSNTFGTFDHSEGLTLRTPAATLDGQGYQVSAIATDGFSFHGVADVFASASHQIDYLPDYTESIEGNASGNASVSLHWTFAVDSTSAWRFSGSHNLYNARGGYGSYSLTGNNGFAWDDQGASGFSSTLVLTPGTYTFDVSLSAYAQQSYQGDHGGRAQADFALSAVPEPSTLALMVPGLLLVAGLARQRHRSALPRVSTR